MRRRSLTGPIILILVGAAFLMYNLRPDIQLLDLMSEYWPLLLIAWGFLRLIEVVVDYSRGTLSSTPRVGGGEVVLILFICFIGWGFLSLHRLGFRFSPIWETGKEFTVSKQEPVGQAKRFVFEGGRGNIRITGGDTTDIVVSGRKSVRGVQNAEADRVNDSTPLEIVKDGDTVTVRTNQDRNSGGGRIAEDLEITIPGGMNVDARGSDGDYDVSEMRGNVELHIEASDVRLNNIGGNARVELQSSKLVRAVDVKGDLDLQGRGSDVELENITGQVTINGSYDGRLDFKNLAKPMHFESPNTDLRVAALPGEITMSLGDLTGNNLVGPVHLVTRSKDVKFEDFTNSLELETDRGDIELLPKHVPLAKIEARSRSGQISLALPEKAAFQLTASTDHGEAVNDFGAPIQKESDGKSASLKGTVGQGATIHMVTGRGTVSVRKAGADSEDRDKSEKPEKAET